MAATYNEIYNLIHTKQLDEAESCLQSISRKNDKWHFFYSQLLMERSWFSSAKDHLEQAIALNPEETLYQKTLAKLMGRSSSYSKSYYRHRRHRRPHCACCCCDCCDCDCCEFSCCDLICLDTCCECMGGDLIDCI